MFLEKRYLLMYEVKQEDGTIDYCCQALLSKECVPKTEKHLKKIYGKNLRITYRNFQPFHLSLATKTCD